MEPTLADALYAVNESLTALAKAVASAEEVARGFHVQCTRCSAGFRGHLDFTKHRRGPCGDADRRAGASWAVPAGDPDA